jgi:histone H3/H4
MANEILVVASKVKTYIRENGECNTAAEAIEAISKVVEKILASAVENAKGQGRKTVMARDVVVPVTTDASGANDAN